MFPKLFYNDGMLTYFFMEGVHACSYIISQDIFFYGDMCFDEWEKLLIGKDLMKDLIELKGDNANKLMMVFKNG